MNPQGLYAITPDCADTDRLLDRTEAVLRGGARWLQYRNKSMDAVLRFQQAEALCALARRFGVPLIVNDDIELAAQIGAQGVHLGRGDPSPRQARSRLGARAVIGASCYGDIQRAEYMAAEGANYLAFGAFFPSPTKPHASAVDFGLLGAAKSFGLPVVAIGGITPVNAPYVIAAGADGVALISGVFAAPDPEQSARAIAALFTESKPGSRGRGIHE